MRGMTEMEHSIKVAMAEVKDMVGCNGCGAEISVRGKSGLCNPCSMRRASQLRFQKNRGCKECGCRITDYNQSGLCVLCHKREWNRKQRALRKQRRVYKAVAIPGGRCRICGDPFYLKADQDPRWTWWCPGCRIATHDERSGGNWLHQQSILS